MTAYEINGKEYEVDYDLDNRIIKADIDGDDGEYRYDAFGRRVIRKEGSTKTALIWWSNSECAEYKHSSGQASIQNDLFAHPTRLNAVIARAVDGSKSKLQWYHKNYLDHVYAVSDDDGDILEHYRYTAFGEVSIYNATGVQQATSQINNQILWNTRRRDELTGFYMYKYRHYSAELGRWPSRDPIEEKGGINLYTFVANLPLSRWDYLGLKLDMVDWNDVNCENLCKMALGDAAKERCIKRCEARKRGENPNAGIPEQLLFGILVIDKSCKGKEEKLLKNFTYLAEVEADLDNNDLPDPKVFRSIPAGGNKVAADAVYFGDGTAWKIPNTTTVTIYCLCENGKDFWRAIGKGLPIPFTDRDDIVEWEEGKNPPRAWPNGARDSDDPLAPYTGEPTDTPLDPLSPLGQNDWWPDGRVRP